MSDQIFLVSPHPPNVILNTYLVSKQPSDYYIGVDFMEQLPSAKLQFIVGDIGYAFNNDIGIFYDFV
jgi:hypothetical protein